MTYNQAFWFNFLLYMSEVSFFTFGSMAFVKYLMKRER